MIRPIRPLDVARFVMLGGPSRPNRAFTLDTMVGGPQPKLPLKDAAGASLLLNRKGVCCVTRTEGASVVGIAAARPRSGPRSWEISHLLVESDEDAGCSELFNELNVGVAQRAGERVFMRLQAGEPLAETARHSGFVPCGEETVFLGPKLSLDNEEPIALRMSTPSDEYGLFRLYNAATPASIRLQAGMTFDLWSSSRERVRGRPQEFIYEEGGHVMAWLRTTRMARVGHLVMMVHPDAETKTAALVAFGSLELGKSNMMSCVVPAHQQILQSLLSREGYDVIGEYVTLVRSMLAPALVEKARQAVPVSPA